MSITAEVRRRAQKPIPVEVPEQPPAVRAASDLLREALPAATEARQALDAAEAALRVAKHNDTAAEADAVRAGTKPPKLTAPGAAEDLAAASHALEVRQRIVDDAQRDLLAAVATHRDEWLTALRAASDDRLQRFHDALDAVEDALTACATAGHAVAQLERFDGALIDLRATVEVGDNGAMLPARSSVLIEALRTMTTRATGEQISATTNAVQQRAKERLRARRKQADRTGAAA